MPRISQKGFAPILIFIVLLLIAGVVLGVYLVKNQTFFTPNASVSGPVSPETSLTLFDKDSNCPPFSSQSCQLKPHPVGSNITVKILIRSDFDSANQFVAKIKFPQSLVNVVSLDTTAESSGSAEVYAVSSWLEEFFDNNTGEISLVGGVPDPGLKTDPNSPNRFVMATINLKAVGAGTASLQLLPESAIYRNSDNTNILTTSRGLALDIIPVQSVSPSPSGSGQPSRRAFITKSNYNGNLGGVGGADAKCQSSADLAGIGGTWKAWISDNGNQAENRLIHSTIPYKLLNGKIIANNWNDLIDGNLNSPINITENGSPKEPSFGLYRVWTGTDYQGRSYFNQTKNCSNWTSSTAVNPAPSVWDPQHPFRTTGDTGDWQERLSKLPLGYWTLTLNTSCDTNLPLYCLEQDQSPLPTDDSDSDKFTDAQESFMGTDPKRACPNSTIDNAWPPDTTNDAAVNGADVSKLVPFIDGSMTYNKRYDLNQDGKIDQAGDVAVIQKFFLQVCNQNTTPTPTPISYPSPVVTPTPMSACGTSCSNDTQCLSAKDGCTTCLVTQNSSGVCAPKPSPTPTASPSPCNQIMSVVNSLTSLVGINTCPTPTPTSTPTPSPSPTPVPVACSPRPNVVRSTSMTSEGMKVMLSEGVNVGTPKNPFSQIKFTSLSNALVVFSGKEYKAPVNLTLASGTTSFEFLIKQLTYGQATTVQMVVIDTCGDYSLFFGGGATIGWPNPDAQLTPNGSGLAVATATPVGHTTNSNLPSACVGFDLGDGNKDRKLDLKDSSYLLSRIGKNVSDCADMNGDGVVNVIDLSIMRKLFIEKSIIRVRA